MKTFFGRALLTGTAFGLFAASGMAQVSGFGTSESLQLLVDSTTNRAPLALSTIGTPVAVVAGAASAYALNADGTVTAWGNNAGNQLARPFDGTAGSAPALVAGLPPVTKVFAASSSGYALTATGSLWAWGFNGWGELGVGTAENAVSPVFVGEFGANAKVVGGDSKAFILKGDGTLYGAGYNYNWDLGLGDRSARNTFTQIPLANVRSAAFGGLRAAVAATTDGTVYTWGRNFYGETYTTPTVQAGLSGIVKVAGVPGAAYAIDASGTVYSWGLNTDGVLGRPTTGDEEVPTAIPGLPPIAEVFGSQGGTAYALAKDGTVWAWGNNDYGQIGDGSSTDRYAPVQVAGLSGVTSIAAGRSFVLTLTQQAKRRVEAFTLATPTTHGYRTLKGKVVLDGPAGPGGEVVALSSRAVGSILPHGLAPTNYNGLTFDSVPSPRASLRKVWRIRNRTNSTHTYRLIVVGVTDVVTGSVPGNSDGYFVSKMLSWLPTITLFLDDACHVELDVATGATGPVPTNVFASVNIPASVTVPQGATEVEFDVFANEVPVDATVEIVATQGSIVKVAPLKIVLESDRPQS